MKGLLCVFMFLKFAILILAGFKLNYWASESPLLISCFSNEDVSIGQLDS